MKTRYWLLLAALGGVLALTGAVSRDGTGEVLDRTVPVLLFLLGITVVAVLADRAGLFEVAADAAARLARGRRWVLWLLVVVLASACTIALSLDTTAVLLTPIVLVLARRTGTSPVLMATTTVWLANTASLLLPVSNLTNLLALETLGGSPTDFLATTAPAALTVLVLSVVLLAVLFRQDLRGRYEIAPPAGEHHHDRVLLVGAGVVCLALVPVVVSGAPVHWAALTAAAVLLALTLWRRRVDPALGTARGALRELVDAPLLVGVLGLFLVMQALQEHGLQGLLASAAGTGEGAGALLRVAAVGALASNAVNNLPAFLALEPVAGSAQRLVALLVGTNAGPVITPWASLATVLWAQRCRAAGLEVDWLAFAARGALLAVLVVVAGTGVLVITGA